MLNFNL